ncbi:MAG: hypothetical protein AB7T14_00740 [Candidatus Methylacidiphilaceae bacterium]
MNWEQVGALIGAVVVIVFSGFVLLAFRMKHLRSRLEEVAQELSGVRSDLSAWEKELRTVRAEAQNMRGELQGTRSELQNLRAEMHDQWGTMASVKEVLHRDFLVPANAGGALPSPPGAGGVSDPGGVSPAASEQRVRSTANDWLRQETLQRLSR